MAVQHELPEKRARNAGNLGAWLGFALVFALCGGTLLATARVATDFVIARVCFALAIACVVCPALVALKRRLTPALGTTGALLGMFGVAALALAAVLLLFRIVGD